MDTVGLIVNGDTLSKMLLLNMWVVSQVSSVEQNCVKFNILDITLSVTFGPFFAEALLIYVNKVNKTTIADNTPKPFIMKFVEIFIWKINLGVRVASK